MSHRFIEVCQASRVEHAVYRHVLVYDNAGLCAVASLSAMAVRLELLAPRAARPPVRLLRRLDPSFMIVPTLFCGLPVSFGRPCLRMRADTDREDALAAISEVMDAVASELGARLLCFKEFDPRESTAVLGLERLGFFRAPSLPSYGLPIRWRTAVEYVAAMRAGYRRQLLKTRARALGCGIRFRVVQGAAIGDAAIVRLYEQVMDHAEFQLERLNAAFFAELGERFGSECRAILAERNGEPVAAAILLGRGRRPAFLLAGIDYGSNREASAYVSLIAELIAMAIADGAEYIELGQTSHALKTRLGAVEVPRDLYLRATSSGFHRLLRAAAPVLFPKRSAPPRRVFR